jgi:uncharacterized protein
MNVGNFSIEDNLFYSLIKKYSLSEVALFGSVIREDYSDNSDIDILISFTANSKKSLFDIINLKYDFECILNRKVDVIEKSALKNPFRKNEILKTARVIYAA